MKKFIMIIMLMVCFCSLFATEKLSPKNNELSFKIGVFPYIETVMTSLLVLGHKNVTDTLLLPIVTTKFLHYVNPYHAFGGALTLGSPVASYGESIGIIPCFSLQGIYQGIYLNKEKIKLYGELALGFELFFDIPTKSLAPFFAAYVAPIGIWFGSEKFLGTAELGIGTQGTGILLGCGFRF